LDKVLKSWNLGACKSVVITEKDILDILQKEKQYLQEKFGLLSIEMRNSLLKSSQDCN